MRATFTEEFTVYHSERPEVNAEFITVSVPNGWDDVKKITNRVILYDGRKFIWCGWNSDRNEAFFKRPLVGDEPATAKFIK